MHDHLGDKSRTANSEERMSVAERRFDRQSRMGLGKSMIVGTGTT